MIIECSELKMDPLSITKGDNGDHHSRYWRSVDCRQWQSIVFWSPLLPVAKFAKTPDIFA